MAFSMGARLLWLLKILMKFNCNCLWSQQISIAFMSLSPFSSCNCWLMGR